MIYSANEVMDIFLVLGECRREYRPAARLYRERYSNRLRYSSASCIRKIERNYRRGRALQP